MEIFAVKPIVWKLVNLREARSKICKTQDLMENSRTKMLNRGSPAFMAPEISIPESMLKLANLDQLRAVDIWGHLMTLFVTRNPDQCYQFQHEMEQVQKHDQQLNSEEIFIDFHYQHVREMIYQHLKYRAEDRCDVKTLPWHLQCHSQRCSPWIGIHAL